jgi:DNA-binding CsgD family transcriptional regulator
MNSPERMARASLGYEDALLAAGTARQGADDPSILLQREALRSLGEEHNALRARVLAALGQALHFSGVRDEAAEVTQQAVDLARELNDDGALARALNVQFIVMWGPTYPRERLAVLTDMIQAADSAGDEELVVEGTMWRLRTLNELGDMPQVEAEFDAYYERAEALREPQYRAHALSCKAAHAHLRGAMDQSAELFSQALSLGQLVQSPNLSTLFLAWQIDVARDRGDIELLRELRLEAEPIAQQVYPWRVFAMLMDCELGEMDAAREHFRTVARIDYQAMLQHWLGMRTASRLAEVCWRLDDDVEAARLYPVIVPYAEQYVIGDVALGSVSRYLGLLAATQRDWASAEKHFKVGLYLNGAIGHRFQTAHTQADFATVALRRGRADDAVLARELLQQALTSYRELGAEYHAERASALLSETSLPGPKARSTARPAGLTEREVEVVALIAAGRTNAEIAEALVLSVRTVERHITNAYAKIDARGKADATAFALRHGLVTPSS